MNALRGGRVRRAARLGRGGVILGIAVGWMAPAVIGPASAQEPTPGAASVAEQIFFQRLHDLVTARNWPEAVRHIQQLQALRTEPAWLAPREGELRLAQIHISRGQGDLTGMLTAARLYLNGDEARSQQLLELARQLHAAGDKTWAIALLKEVVHRTPKFVPASRLLAEWEPPAEKKPARPAPKPVVAPPMTGRRTEPVAPSPPVGRKSAPVSEQDEAAAQLAALRNAHEQDDRPAMLAAARLFLTGDRARSQRLLEVAREFHGRGDSTAAKMLIREVLRRTPGFPPAQRLLNELEAAPKPQP